MLAVSSAGMRYLRPGEVIEDLLEPYRSTDRTPPASGPGCWVMANMVAGLDGCAAVGGRVGALSGGVDAELFRQLRALADVVLVGAETVRREGYGPVKVSDAEQARRRAEGRPPLPPVAVVSRSLSFDFGSDLFTAPADDARTMIITCRAAAPERLAQVSPLAEVVMAGEEQVEPRLALSVLAQLGAKVVLCEGGPSLLGEIVAAGLLDELCLTVSPVMGGDPLPVAITPQGTDLAQFGVSGVAEHDGTLFLRYLNEARDR